MEDSDEYEEEEINHKINIIKKVLKFAIITILIFAIYNLFDKDINEENNLDNKQYIEQNYNKTLNITNNEDNKEQIQNDTKIDFEGLIKISEYNNKKIKIIRLIFRKLFILI